MGTANQTSHRTVQQLVDDAMSDVQAIISHEKALASAELKSSGIKAGIGAGLIGGALTLLFFSTIPLSIAVAELFVRAGMARWGAYLLTWGISVVVALILAGVAVLVLRRISPPRRTIAAAKETIAHLRGRAGLGGQPATGHPTEQGPGSTAADSWSTVPRTSDSSPAVKA